MPKTFSAEMEVVLINSSGGLTGGDRMQWEIVAGADTAVTVTTQACEKIYKASSDTAGVTTRLEAGRGAKLHWLPQETILFDKASLTRKLDVHLDETAEFLAVEAVLLGRKAMGEAMTQGLFRDRWRIFREGKLIHAEEARLDGDIADLTSRAPVLDGQVAFATLLYAGPAAEAMLPKVRLALGENAGGVSVWHEKLVVRLVAPDGFALRKFLLPIISVLRNGAPVPKVWNL
jgi:urease accessory protein